MKSNRYFEIVKFMAGKIILTLIAPQYFVLTYFFAKLQRFINNFVFSSYLKGYSCKLFIMQDKIYWIDIFAIIIDHLRLQ